MNKITIPIAADFHVHLRQGSVMEAVTPLVSQGGCNVAYVMPNLQPPIKTTQQALAYRDALQKLAPGVQFLMTLYLSPELTPEEIKIAAKAGIAGVKSYPRGVTTNSDGGIESYSTYYPVFKEMEIQGMVLNLHGEVPSNPEDNICVLNAEERFLKHLIQLHKDFPKLRIVLEHATTKAAVDVVKSLGDTVACTITPHHLRIVVDDWAANPHNYCKPVAKYPTDRRALQQIVKEGHPRFFLGTDSAPHLENSKLAVPCAAGVFTTPHVLPYVATILESFDALDRLEDFVSIFGRRFYNMQVPKETITLVKKPLLVAKSFAGGKLENERIIPFMAGQQLAWSIE